MRKLEQTSNGVKYDWYLASADGASFIFFKYNHTDEEVKEAIKEIKNTRDCVHYRIANINDYVDMYWGEVFEIAENKYRLNWKQIDYDYSSLEKAYKKGVPAEEYVDEHHKKWSKTVNVKR